MGSKPPGRPLSSVYYVHLSSPSFFFRFFLFLSLSFLVGNERGNSAVRYISFLTSWSQQELGSQVCLPVWVCGRVTWNRAGDIPPKGAGVGGWQVWVSGWGTVVVPEPRCHGGVWWCASNSLGHQSIVASSIGQSTQSQLYAHKLTRCVVFHLLAWSSTTCMYLCRLLAWWLKFAFRPHQLVFIRY